MIEFLLRESPLVLTLIAFDVLVIIAYYIIDKKYLRKP